jgi:hypothetical protein
MRLFVLRVVAKLRVVPQSQRGGLSDKYEDEEQRENGFELHLIYYKDIHLVQHLN